MRRPSPALVLAFVALFAALAGGAIAAKKAARNTVVTKSIKNLAVKRAKLALDAAGADQVDEASLVFPAPTFTDATLEEVTNFGGVFAKAGFAKDQLGFVHLRGTMNCPGGGKIAFHLPAGFRPAASLFASLATSQSGGISHLTIKADGEVRVLTTDPVTCGIDGISFLAEQ
jgi:hypothetical protein